MFVKLQTSKFCAGSEGTQAGPLYNYMASRMWQLHCYNRKPLSQYVTPLKFGIRISAALANFSPSKPLRFQFEFKVTHPGFSNDDYSLQKYSFFLFVTSYILLAVPYRIVFAWETECVVSTKPQPFSTSDIRLKCSVSLFSIYLMLLPSCACCLPSVISLPEIVWTIEPLCYGSLHLDCMLHVN